MILKTLNIIRKQNLSFCASRSLQWPIVCQGTLPRRRVYAVSDHLLSRSSPGVTLTANFWNRTRIGSGLRAVADNALKKKPGVLTKPNENKKDDKKPKMNAKGWYLFAGAVIFSGVIGYINYDNEFRQTLNGLILRKDKGNSIASEENASRSNYLLRRVERLKTAFKGYLVRGKSPATTSTEQMIDLPGHVKRNMFDASPMPDALNQKSDPELTADPENDDRPPEDETSRLSEGHHTLTLGALEERMGSAAELAVKNYNDAICALRGHVDEVDKLIETSVERVDSGKCSSNIDFHEKEQLVKEAEINARIVEESIRQIKESIESPRLVNESELKDRVEKDIRKVLSDIAEARTSFERAEFEYSSPEKHSSDLQLVKKKT